MSVPQAGPIGMKQVHALRGVLLSARDRHPELLHNPEKQLLVDALFRKLATTPDTGLEYTTDIPEIISLMQAIDVPLAEVPKESMPLTATKRTDWASKEEENLSSTFGRKHKTMSITVDEDELTQHNIAIKIATDASEEIVRLEARMQSLQSEPNISKLPPIVKEDISLVEQKAIGQIESIDPINIVIEKPVQPRVPTSILTDEAGQQESGETEPMSYKFFVEKRFGSMDNFGKEVNNEVSRIEALTSDRFAGWLGEQKSSPFDMIQDMKVGEVLTLKTQKGLREQLQQKNIQYETMLTWLDLLPEMLDLTGVDANTSFGETFAYWIIESEMAQIEA